MKLKFRSKLLMIGLIPGVLIALALLVVATGSMRMHITEEKLNTLHATARGIAFETPQKALEAYKRELGIDVTVFEDKKRIRSTVEGAEGTDASTEELGATIEMVSTEADKLTGIASQLVEQVAIFKV